MGDKKFKTKICVSGAAETGHCGIDSFEIAKELGREIVRQGSILITGATTGFPLWSAMGAKDANGVSIGLSPASSEREHTNVYRLPLDYMDLIIYTGFGYSGRNLLLTRSADAVIVGCGRIGTINEFTIAYEDGKPIGVLEGDWATDEVIKEMMAKSHRTNKNVVFSRDPKKLVEELHKLVEIQKKQNNFYENHDGVMGKIGDIIL
jgi:uncharacterized protein (TIGR00725 family)